MADLLFKSSWTSIVFEGRNKHYGAFELRQSYERHMLSALFCTLISVGLLAGVIVTVKWLSDSPAPIVEEITPVICFIDPRASVMPETKVVLPKATPNSSNRTSPSIVPVQAVTASTSTSTTATPTEVGDAAPSTINASPESGGTNSGNTGTEIPGISSSPVGNETEATWDAAAYAEVMPQFKGNLKAYIAKEFEYPSLAVGNGIEGKVLVEVILDEEGKVRKAKILRSLGYGCDEEALRVVYAMPNWEPAKVGNRPVKIKMVIPITLKLQ